MAADPSIERTGASADIATKAPWWRFPIVWLVIGGPALVVIASVITVVIAVRNVDPVLDVSKTDVKSEQAPALLGRNHSAEAATQPADK